MKTVVANVKFCSTWPEGFNRPFDNKKVKPSLIFGSADNMQITVRIYVKFGEKFDGFLEILAFFESEWKVEMRLFRFVAEAKKYPLTWNGYILGFWHDFSLKVSSFEAHTSQLSTNAKIYENSLLNKKICLILCWVILENPPCKVKGTTVHL